MARALGLANLLDHQVGGRRNLIINSNFDVWQRGTSGSTGYVADRWRTLAASSTTTVSQQSFTLGQTDVPNEPEYFHRVVVASASGASNYAVLQQRIEFVRTFAGQTVTVSFWAKANAAKDIAVEFSQDFGSGGSAGVFGVGVTTCSLTTSWQKFTATADIPSISGKTIGTNQSSFDITFWFDAGSDHNSRSNSLGQQSGTFDIAQVQLEAGETATPFEHRSYGEELALCQRYYQVIEYSTVGQQDSVYSTDHFSVPFNTMRVQPTLDAFTFTKQGHIGGSLTDLGGATIAYFDNSVRFLWSSTDSKYRNYGYRVDGSMSLKAEL